MTHSFDVNAARFDELVIRQSEQVPVLVDFWASWCGPCQALTPLLERLADEYAGQFLLAKVDTEAEAQLALQYAIRALPSLKLFRTGVVVEELTGVQPEPVIRAAIDAHTESEADRRRAQGRQLLRDGATQEAVTMLEETHATWPDDSKVAIDLAMALLTVARHAEAQDLLDRLPANASQERNAKVARASIAFARAADGATSSATLETRLSADPGDLTTRYRLGALFVLHGEYERALEQFFEIMQRDRSFKDDAGKASILAVFELLNGEGELVRRYRGKLAASLY